MKPVRFHFIYAFRMLRNSLPLLLLPMLRLLVKLDWENFFIALQQNLILLIFLSCLAVFFWVFTASTWGEEELYFRVGFLFTRVQRFRPSQVSAIVLRRPFYCRMLGATCVYLYFTAGKTQTYYRVYLSKKSALALKNTIFPISDSPRATYSLSWAKRIAFILLSADIISTFVLGFLGWRQLSQFIQNDDLGLVQLAIDGFMNFEQMLALLLPAGIALLVAWLFLLAMFTIIRSLFQTVNYTACRYKKVLQTSFGIINQTQTTIRLRSISYCDVRHTPLSRILRYYPVHIAAGRYSTRELPLLICKAGQDSLIQGLLPQWHGFDGLSISNNGIKSIMTYIWFPFSFFTFFSFLLLSSWQFLPDYLYLFILPSALFLGSCLAHLEAYFFEGITKHPRGGLALSSTRFFTRHRILLFDPDYTFKIKTNPIGLLEGRCTLRIIGRTVGRIRIRGVSIFTANTIPLN